MNVLNKKIIILAVIMSLITTCLIFVYLKNIKKTVYSEQKMAIVANQKILPRTQIQSNMLKKVKVLKESYIPNCIADESEIVGKYTKDTIFEGEFIKQERLVAKQENDLTYRIPKGKRAVSILSDEVNGVADLLKPNDMVDIYVTLDEVKTEEQNLPQTTKLILQNIEVLAVSREIDRKEELRKQTPTKYAVTLAVTQQEAEKLILSEQSGKIKLALRPFNETSIGITKGVIRSDVFN